MKILYIGKFELPHRTENYVSWALEKLGHEVTKLDYQCCDGLSDPSRAWIMKTRGVYPDLVLFSKNCPRESKQYLEWLKERGITTVCWQWDLFFNHHLRHHRPLPAHFKEVDFLFTTDSGNHERFLEVGCNHHVLRQGIHEPEAFQVEQEPTIDVAFVGSVRGSHPSRRRLIYFLQNMYRNRFRQVDNKRGKALNNFLSRSKVIVGDSYPSKDYWSNRVYEITGRGGFLIHPRIEGEEFEKEFPLVESGVFGYQRDDFQDLKFSIDKLIEEDGFRNELREDSFKWTKKRYTYTKRVEELLEVIQPSLV